MAAGKTRQWLDIDGDLRHLTCTHCRGSMIESLLLREQIHDCYDVINDDGYVDSPAGAAFAAAAGAASSSSGAAFSSDAPVNLVASHSLVPFSEDLPAPPDVWSCPEFDSDHCHQPWVTVEDLDGTEFDGTSVGTRQAPVSDSVAPRHPSRRQLEATVFTIRSAPKAACQALPVDVEETKMHLILNTGCQRTVAGIDWLKQARQDFLRRFLLKCDIPTESRKFQFGPRGPEMSF